MVSFQETSEHDSIYRRGNWNCRACFVADRRRARILVGAHCNRFGLWSFVGRRPNRICQKFSEEKTSNVGCKNMVIGYSYSSGCDMVAGLGVGMGRKQISSFMTEQT